MISTVKEVVTENPVGQIWKFLRFFLDVPSTEEKIRQIHNIEPGKHTANVRKQAEQISYSIRQAEEYFRASTQVGLATRPTLLYYGAVSLSQALILLKQNGDYSIDVLRKQRRHNHHGLDLEREIISNIKNYSTAEEFFGLLRCQLHTSPQGEPWGHFPLFYQSLVPGSASSDITIHDIVSGVIESDQIPYSLPKIKDIKQILSSKFVLLELFKQLPDMYHILQEYNIVPRISKGTAKRDHTRYYPNDTDDGRINAEYFFNIDEIEADSKSKFIEYYKSINPSIEIVYNKGISLILSINYRYKESEKMPHKSLLNYIDDIMGKIYYINNPDDYFPESASYLMLLFCLGMLSRYYPDVWVRTIDQNIRIAEITDSILGFAYRKFPNLILDQMTLTKYLVHS